MLAFGYAFLYLPIALVIVYSFNESRLVTVWSGFSLKWWHALFANEAMLERRLAVAAHRPGERHRRRRCIGLAAGYALVRAPRFSGPHAVRQPGRSRPW